MCSFDLVIAVFEGFNLLSTVLSIFKDWFLHFIRFTTFLKSTFFVNSNCTIELFKGITPLGIKTSFERLKMVLWTAGGQMFVYEKSCFCGVIPQRMSLRLICQSRMHAILFNAITLTQSAFNLVTIKKWRRRITHAMWIKPIEEEAKGKRF